MWRRIRYAIEDVIIVATFALAGAGVWLAMHGRHSFR